MIDVSNGWDVSFLVDLHGFGEAFNAENINDVDISVVLTGIVVLLEEFDEPKTV